MTTSTKKTNKEVLTKTIVMSYDNFESAVVSFLYSMGAIPDDWDILCTDLEVPLNDEGLVEFDIEVVKPVGKKNNLRLIKDGEEENTQLSLQLEAFDKINVPDF